MIRTQNLKEWSTFLKRHHTFMWMYSQIKLVKFIVIVIYLQSTNPV